MNLLPTSSLLPPAGSCDRMLGVHAHEALSSPPSLDSHTGDAVRATGGWPCLHPPCASSRAHHPAHHPAHYIAHGHMQRRAYMGALAHVYMRNVAYAHSTSLTRHTCAHMSTCTLHVHSQTDRFTHTDGISQERHTHTHPRTHMHTRTYTKLPTYTHEHTQTHKRTCARTCLHTHINTNEHTQTHKRTCTHTHIYTNVCVHV